jgi:hypothetical protein
MYLDMAIGKRYILMENDVYMENNMENDVYF